MNLKDKYKAAYNSFEQERKIYDFKFTCPPLPKIEEIENYLEPDENLRKIKPISTKHKLSTEELITEYEKWDNGVFFFNGDDNDNIILEYITGLHYKMLSTWQLSLEKGEEPFGAPEFVDAHRDVFYIWDLVDKSDSCFGLLFYTCRRWGKSAISSFLAWHYSTSFRQVNVAIQSKTKPDSEELFAKIVDSWRAMNRAFVPLDSGITNPKDKMLFSEPSKRKVDGSEKQYKSALNSKILTFSSTEKALDGLKYKFVLEDEFAKREDTDVRKTWNVVKETLARGSKIAGKAFCTSTVEELEGGGGKEGKHVWDNSDSKDLNANGRTRSGLWRLFIPAFYGYQGEDPLTGVKFVNDWGYSNQAAAKAFMERERKSLSGSDLLSYKRKYPFTEEDMFIDVRLESIFSTYNLTNQRDFNDRLDSGHIRKGNFFWSNGRGSAVNFRDDPNGRWLVAWQPKVEERNRVYLKAGVLVSEINECVAGCDPVDNRITADQRHSMASSHVFRRTNLLEPDQSNMFVAEYIHRHEDPLFFYEDMAMQCFFYSCKLLCENNKIGLINYFRANGYEGLLMKRPQETMSDWTKRHEGEKYGVPLSGDSARLVLIEAWQSYISSEVGYDHETDKYGKFFFNRSIDQLLDFNLDKWTDYDAVVSGGLTLIAARNAVIPHTPINVLNFHKKKKGNGNKGRDW